MKYSLENGISAVLYTVQVFWPEMSVISRPQPNPRARSPGVRLRAGDDWHFRLQVCLLWFNICSYWMLLFCWCFFSDLKTGLCRSENRFSPTPKPAFADPKTGFCRSSKRFSPTPKPVLANPKNRFLSISKPKPVFPILRPVFADLKTGFCRS